MCECTCAGLIVSFVISNKVHSRNDTRRIVRKNVGCIAKMPMMDSRVSARKFIPIELCFVVVAVRPNNYTETSPAFRAFSDAKKRSSLYFVLRATITCRLSSLSPSPLLFGLIFVCIAKGFFFCGNFAGVHFFQIGK